MTVISSHYNKLIYIGILHVEKIAKVVFLYVFDIAFSANSVLKSYITKNISKILQVCQHLDLSVQICAITTLNDNKNGQSACPFHIFAPAARHTTFTPVLTPPLLPCQSRLVPPYLQSKVHIGLWSADILYTNPYIFSPHTSNPKCDHVTLFWLLIIGWYFTLTFGSSKR